MKPLILALLLAGCASAPPPSFDTSGRDPACSRQCLSSYSTCVSGAGVTTNRLIAGDMLNACQGVTRQCISTCTSQ